MIVLIDNYDSFTYNIYQYLRELTDEPVRTIRNDAASVEEVLGLLSEGGSGSKVIISPGPGRPEGAGISVELVRRIPREIGVLGVCLGHQVIGAAYGAKIVSSANIVHGKVEDMSFDGRGLFRTIGKTARCTRYHSLAIDRKTLSGEFIVTATAHDGEIMGIRHRERPLEGVQFHPESLGSKEGKEMIRNFLHYRRAPFVVSRYIESLQGGSDMTRQESADFMNELTDGGLGETQIAALLVGLNAKGVCGDELAGCAEVLVGKCTALPLPESVAARVTDTCGTGGDGLGTYNISSLAAIVACAGGAVIAKHGNRAVSSQTGSADFYQALGYPLDLTPEQSAQLLEKHGFAFLFAPMYHSAMRYAAPVRGALGVKTIFNLLGPLVSPARPRHQLIGVYDKKFAEQIARAAHLLGVGSAFVVHSDDNQDELSVCAPSTITAVDQAGEVRVERFDPRDYGVGGHALAELTGGDSAENAEAARKLLSGGNSGRSALRDAVVVNSAAALVVSGVHNDFAAAIPAAGEVLDSGGAWKKWQEIVSSAQSFSVA